jgi:hypothetical protein
MSENIPATNPRLRTLEREPEPRIVSIIYERDGKIFHAWPTPQAELQELGLDRNGQCTCGSPDFCDTFAHRRIRCFSVSPGRCELFTTNDVC